LELRKKGTVLRRIRGWLQTWSLWSDGNADRATFTYWTGDANDEPGQATAKTRVVVDGNGHVIAESRFTDSVEGDAELGLVFSGDGHALYEDESFPAEIMQRIDART